jgi:AcrR family transcriptional regulator
MTAIAMRTKARPSTRERIVSASYDLFTTRGIRDVAMDDVAASSGVAKATLYRHFPSKNELAIAFLERRESVWTLGFVEAEILSRSGDPIGRLLAIFDVFDEWFTRGDFEACSFVNALLEMGPDHAIGRASIGHLANIRSMVAGLATDAGLRETENFARSLHILMNGSIVQATEGDLDAARLAKTMARNLIDRHRP